MHNIQEFTVMSDKQVKIRPASHEDPMSFPTEDSLDNSVQSSPRRDKASHSLRKYKMQWQNHIEKTKD